MKVSLRQQALYLPQTAADGQRLTANGQRSAAHGHGAAVNGQGAAADSQGLSSRTLALVAELRQLGYTLSEDLLHALNSLDEADQQQVLDVINEVMGTTLNWASLVRGWLTPTGESAWDHFLTLLANVVKDEVEIGRAHV